MNTPDPLVTRGPAAVAVAVLLPVTLVGYALLYWASLHAYWHARGVWFVVLGSVGWLAAVALLAHARLRPRQLLAVVFGVAALLQMLGWTSRPTTSDDAYRYIWDGTVQLHGVDPYRYPPQAPQLANLHSQLLFGASPICQHAIPNGCTAINRPDVHTVYPPVAQAAFDVVRVVSIGGRGGVLPFQIAASLGVLAVGALLARWRLRAGRALWPVAVWAWCPLVVVEFGNNAHLDWLAVLLAVLALRVAAAGRPGAAGALLGAAVATKLYPIVLLPVLAARRGGRVVAALLAVVVVGYLPHLIAVGGEVIGYLPGYLDEEGYQSGSRLLLLGHVLPHPVDTVVGGLVLLAAAVVSFRRQQRGDDDPLTAATVLTGVVFLVTTPAYGWYAALLVALVALSERYEWLPVALAPMITYLVYGEITHAGWPGPVAYLIAGVVAATGTIWRARRASRRSAEEPVPAPVATRSAVVGPARRERSPAN